MRTRNSGNPKPAPPKKTPPTRKSAGKATAKAAVSANSNPVTPKPAETKRTAAIRAKQAKKSYEATPTPSKLEPEADLAEVTPKSASASKSGAKNPRRTRSTTKVLLTETPKLETTAEVEDEEPTIKEEVADAQLTDCSKEEEHGFGNSMESAKEEENTTPLEKLPTNGGEESKKEQDTACREEELPVTDAEISMKEEDTAYSAEELQVTDAEKSIKDEDAACRAEVLPMTDDEKSMKEEDTACMAEELQMTDAEKSTKEEETACRAEELQMIDAEKSTMEEETACRAEEVHMTDAEKSTEEENIACRAEELPVTDAEESTKEEDTPCRAGELPVTDVENTEKEYNNKTGVEEFSNMHEESEKLNVEDRNVVKMLEIEENVVGEVDKVKEELKVAEKIENVRVDKVVQSEPTSMEEGKNGGIVGEDVKPEASVRRGDDVLEEYNEQKGEETGKEEVAVDVTETATGTDNIEEEHREWTAVAKERRIKKEHEIFVNGLDKNTTADDVRKVFETIGEVVEVRLRKQSPTNKHKGYAFVRFANKEHAIHALADMKNPVICGKQCGTAPSEDNDTLFLGNICNTWTKEAIKQKLKDYGVEGVENITLVPDAQHDGLSRGFAFLEFFCHDEAMLAYKRLQKPDIVFGHPERTAKVAFAEPLRDPDPEIMAQVKTVFVDGLPSHWDENHVREKFKGYGEIQRIMLARNMSTAKRKDFGFIDFTTHKAAVSCIDGINGTEFGTGKFKIKVKARLSNPLPKTQAVKGGMAGGFRIGWTSGGNVSRTERNSGRGGRPSNLGNFQRGRGFYHRGRGHTGGGRMGFPDNHDFRNPYPEFYGRQTFGEGGRGSFRGAYHPYGGGAMAAGPSRPNLDQSRNVPPYRAPQVNVFPRRQPFSPEGNFDRRLVGMQFDDPQFHGDGAHGIKRPFHMTDLDPVYMERGRPHPRLEYSDPAVPFRGPHHRDAFGAANNPYSNDGYGSNLGRGQNSSSYGVNRPHGGGYYY